MERKEKVYALLIAFGSIAAATAPLFLHRLWIENDVSQNDVLVFGVAPAVAMLVFLALPFAAVRLFGPLARFELVWVRRPFTKVRWLLLLMASVLLLNIIIGVIARYTGWPAEWQVECQPAASLTLGIVIIGAARIVFLTPVAEEIFWRGFIQDQFAKNFGVWIALVLQAVLFALLHRPTLLGFVFILGFGLIQGFWRMKRRSLVPIILSHMMLNAPFVLVNLPGQYERAKINVAVNYVDAINELGQNVSADENASADYELAATHYFEPAECRDLLRKNTPARALTAQQRRGLEDWIGENTEALEHFRRGAGKPVYAPRYSGSVMLEANAPEDIGSLLNMARALVWSAKLHAEDGRLQAAADEIACAMRFGNHLLRGPRPGVWFLAGMAAQKSACDAALQILDRVPPDSTWPASVQRELEEIFAQTPDILDLTWEQFTLYDIIQKTFTDDGQGGGHLPQSNAKSLMPPGFSDEQYEQWEKSDRQTTRRIVDELFAFYADVFTRTPFELHQQDISISKTTSEQTAENILYPYIVNVEGIHRMFYQGQARRGALLTVLAIRQYQDRSGRLPESLDMLLTEGLLAELPMDPFSGQPLVYQSTGSGFKLYSLGPDFDDDGGAENVKPAQTQGDYVFWPAGPLSDNSMRP